MYNETQKENILDLPLIMMLNRDVDVAAELSYFV